LKRSLSVLLPVRDAQSSLAAMVQEFLEVLPELTRDFEVVIADDGSADATIEVADELATCYPQVKVVRHATPLGRVAAIRTALERSTGEILLVRDEDCGLPAGEIHRMWRALDEHEVVLGRPGSPPESRWAAWRTPRAAGRGGLQMLSRRVIGPILGSLQNQATLLAALSQQGHVWHEVETAHRIPGRVARQAPGLARQLLGRKAGQPSRPERSDAPSSGGSGPRRPNYLTRLKDFALGE